MVQKIRTFAGRHRRLLLGLLLVAATLLALGWGWYTTASAAANQPAYQIINDEYDRVVKPADPQAGFVQQLPVDPSAPLYGVRLNFATFNRVVHGSLYADLLDETGEVLASASCDMTQILDNTFLGLVFDQPIFPQEKAVWKLHIYMQPAGPEDEVGLWVGDGQKDMVLTGSADSGEEPISAALQYMVDYTGNVVGRFYWIPALLLAAAVLLGGLLIARHARAQTIFVAAGALLGLAFSLITPPLAAPDEYAHAAASYSMANRLTGQPAYDEEGKLFMRACDAPYMTDVTGEVGPFVYKAVAQHLLEGGHSNSANVPVEVSAPYAPVHPLYAAQTAGVLLARVMGLGFYGMLWLGRLANLALYLLLGWLALRWMPFARDLALCVTLLPMSIQLAASFSPDAFVLGICFALTALALRCTSQPQAVSRGQMAGLVLLCLALGPCKAIYVVLIALCWLIPKEHFGTARKAWIFRWSCVAAALIGWLLYNFQTVAYQFRDVTLSGLPMLALAAVVLGFGLRAAFRRWGKKRAFRVAMCIGLAAVLVMMVALAAFGLLHVGGQITPEQLAQSIQPNGESVYTFSIGYLLRHLPRAVRLVMNTVTEQAPLILQELLGTRLSEPIVYEVEASWIYTVALVLVLIAAALRGQNEQRRLPGVRVWVAGGTAAAALLLVTAACFTWTPINMQHLFGVQGRYLLPVLLPALLCLGETGAFCKKRPCTGGIRLTMVALTALVALQGLGIYAGM